jgi:hypothetical protein
VCPVMAIFHESDLPGEYRQPRRSSGTFIDRPDAWRSHHGGTAGRRPPVGRCPGERELSRTPRFRWTVSTAGQRSTVVHPMNKGPIRRRRRILIAAVLVLIASACPWPSPPVNCRSTRRCSRVGDDEPDAHPSTTSIPPGPRPLPPSPRARLSHDPNIYAAAGMGDLSPRVAGIPPRPRAEQRVEHR